MSSRTAGALIALALLCAVAAWWLASRGENLPLEPKSAAAEVAPPLPEPPQPVAVAQPPAAPPVVALQPPPPPQPQPEPPVPQTDIPPDPRPILPPGMKLPSANFAPDGGVRFPLTRDGIRGAIADARPEIRECYEEWLKANPALAGTLKIGFRIAADGGPEAIVDQVRLVGDAGMGNVAFEGCVLSVMSSLRFDAPPDGVINVTYPLSFSSNDGGPGSR